MPSLQGLMINTKRLEGTEDSDMTKVNNASILKLSDRGISILQGLATITAE